MFCETSLYTYKLNLGYIFKLCQFYLKVFDFHETNPSKAEATFTQSTRMQRFLKTKLNPVILAFIG